MPTPSPRKLWVGARLVLVLAFALLAAVGSASGQDLQGRLSHKQQTLHQKRDRAGVLSSTIKRDSDRIDVLIGQVATLRNRVAIVSTELRRKELELQGDVRRLKSLRGRLDRSLGTLSARLVAIYKSDQPDVLTLILNSSGFDDLLTRYDYLRRIEENDTAVATRVRDLRNQTRSTVDRVTAERDLIASRRAELERTQAELEGQQAQLASARAAKQRSLETVRSQAADLDRDIKQLQDRIAAQLRAAQAQASASVPALPVGPVPGQSASGLIWPVNGVITSPFGPRWGSFHPGLDIGAPMGTPIRAAKAGTIVFAKPYGGYGNYTCIDHGGGLSTCYAHQSAFVVTSGSVDQGQVIGEVGSTGFSTGPHLHFEVRIDGQPVDPLNYL